MKIIIIGVGELGRLLAQTLCNAGYEVVVVDNSGDELEHLGDRLDILRVEGSCTSVATLKKAGIENTDALLAVSGDEPANILSCQLAAKLGVKKTICRLFRSDSFSAEDHISAGDFGIWKTFSTPEESARKILDVLKNRFVKEKIRFSHSDQACMEVVQIPPTSQLLGTRLQDLVCGNLLSNIRIAAALHGSKFIAPGGNTIFGSGDRIYVAGLESDVSQFVEWCSPDESSSGRIVIAGGGETGLFLAQKAHGLGYDVRLIERDPRRIDRISDELAPGIMLMSGDPTEGDLLDEAGTASADVFVSAESDDEDNILAGILAKRMGAKKTVVLTRKPEYIRIVPTMDLIDCGFSASQIAVNTVLRLLGLGIFRIDVNLESYGAKLAEFKVTRNSPLAGKMIKQCGLPSNLALILRGDETITPSGDTVLQPGDTAISIVTEELAKTMKPLFPSERTQAAHTAL